MRKLLAYIYDFLSMVFESEVVDKIDEIILFGSVAKWNYDKESDIDMFFNIKDKKDTKYVEDILKSILKSFEIKAEKTWYLKKIKFPISFIVGSLKDEAWKGLKDEITSSGILLYSKYKEIPENLIHNYLFYYSLNKLKRKDKMKFIRKILGYSLKTKNKKYTQTGILKEINGIRVGPNVFLVPATESQKMKKIFKEFKVDYKIIESWIRL